MVRAGSGVCHGRGEADLACPARDQREDIGGAAAYAVATLQTALALCDPNNFKKFHQSNCVDPVAVRVIALEKLTSAGADKTRRNPKLELHALQKVPGKAAGSGRAEKTPALPQKGGAPDKELLATFPEKSLRRRLWEAISSKKCVRCNGEHLRSACPKDRQAWEDDFEKPDFWTRKFTPPAKQARVQLMSSVNRPCLQILHIVCSAGLCLIDSCSDVTLARRDVLVAVSPRETSVAIAHLGGETILREVGTFTLESEEGREPVILGNVFAVEAGELPAGVVALIGMSDVRRLGLSLDRIAAHPGCSLAEARPFGLTGRLLSCLSGFFSGVARSFRCQPQRRGLSDAPPAHIELRDWPEARPEPALPLPRSLAPEPHSPSCPPSDFLRSFRPTLEELKALHWSQAATSQDSDTHRPFVFSSAAGESEEIHQPTYALTGLSFGAWPTE